MVKRHSIGPLIIIIIILQFYIQTHCVSLSKIAVAKGVPSGKTINILIFPFIFLAVSDHLSTQDTYLLNYLRRQDTYAHKIPTHTGYLRTQDTYAHKIPTHTIFLRTQDTYAHKKPTHTLFRYFWNISFAKFSITKLQNVFYRYNLIIILVYVS